MSKAEVVNAINERVLAGSGGNIEVASECQGTEEDRREMEMLGKKQVLRRQFNFMTMLGFASVVMVAWEFVLVVSPFSLGDGGTPSVFWGLFICPFVMIPIYASLAEVASMSPTAGGQYHFVSELAPPSLQKILSYAVGWLLSLGWQTFLCGELFVTAGLILGLAVLDTGGSYKVQPWHQTLLTICIAVLCLVFNAFFADHLALVESIVFIVHILGVLVVIIPLWITAPHGDARETILHFTVNGGWHDVALAATVGIVPSIGILIGYDCSIHMAEEVKDASINVPWVVMWATGLNAVIVIVVGWTFIFCLGDVGSVLNSATGQPVIQVFYNATQSYAATTVMTVVVIIVFLASAVGETATASRQLWSFARDQGMPGSTWLHRVAPGRNIPLNAIIVSVIITSLLSLINLGSTTAFNAFNSLGTISILFSYTITIACLIWRRLYGTTLPPRRWSLGKFGLWINIVSLCFTLPMVVFYAFPLYQPLTAANMNWASTIFFSVLGISIVYYLFRGRTQYEGPVASVKRE